MSKEAVKRRRKRTKVNYADRAECLKQYLTSIGVDYIKVSEKIII